MLKKILLTLGAVLGILLLVLALGWLIGSGVLFDDSPQPSPTSVARPLILSDDAVAVGDDAKAKDPAAQILFGDLHVHTSYSLDAAIFAIPAIKGTRYVTPADACDFARYCSALDFWSINDHAEGIAPWQWQDTQKAVRECQAISDISASDNLVSFLGWEWTNQASGKVPVSEHYGHKNVIVSNLAAGEVPARPIAAGSGSIWRILGQTPSVMRGLAILGTSRLNLEGYKTLLYHMESISQTPDCPVGPVRELPLNCYESAATPTALFDKLDEWGFDALVIPHGLAWGTTNPIGADFNDQMNQHNEKYQRLLEINSGHGSSEVYRDIPMSQRGDTVCPVPVDGYTACCWQAGEIIRDRCEANGAQDCKGRGDRTQQMYLAALAKGASGNAIRSIVPETRVDDWGQCDQLTDSFQPAFNYQARNTAQYMLTLGDEKKRYRPGFIGSSDNHTGRAGSGYKEVARYYMTDAKDKGPRVIADGSALDQPAKQKTSLPFVEDERDAANAFLFTGGLVAVHSRDQSREAIWEALQNRSVYATSGPRIGLWFDMVDGDGNTHTMGSEVIARDIPRFRVGATGSIKQTPGCPDYVENALGSERMQNLCRNECFYPSDEAYKIDRIEVVRVLPRSSLQENTADLIQDPWRVFDCSEQGSHCMAEFSDPDFLEGGREAAYYVRAIQESTETIHGDPARCEDDNCTQTNYCVGIGEEEDCLSPAQHRAWSSPIYVSP